MFSDSCVRKAYPYRTVETSTAIPDKIFPVYIGSGKCVMSLDALGLQSLNNRVQGPYNCFPNAGDMYIVKNGMVGDAISPHNTLPLGRLTYELEIDGETLDAEALLKDAAMFRRDNDIYRAQVVTSFLVRSKVFVEIAAYIPYGTVSPVFKMRFKNYADCDPHPKELHRVRMRLAFHLNTWNKKSIYSFSVSRDGKIALTAEGHEKYELECAFTSARPLKTGLADETAYAEFEAEAGENWSEVTAVMLSFDGHTAAEEPELEKSHLLAWREYYAQSAFAETGDAAMDFMYRNSLYILKMGYEPAKGYPIGHPFDFPACWQASIFWDAHFTMDALMRSGNKDSAQTFLRLLRGVMRKERKPFPWMFIYDGTTFLEDSRDIAPLVISAQAMIAIRYYEYFRDKTLLKEVLYPILLRCADYARENMFSRRPDGKWEVSLAVSNDVVDEEGTEVNQTYTALWFAVIFRKTAEYANILGKKGGEKFAEIADNIYLEQDGEEYLHCRGYRAEDFVWASWLPFLFYPTEGMPFLDMDKAIATTDKYTYIDLYMEKQNCYQPWTECIEAQSRHRAGEAEEAYGLLRTALGHTFGCGYFSEIGPHQQTVGLPPYISAHAAYVSAYIDMIASSSIWENKAELFMNLPQKLLCGTVRAGGIYGAGKLYVERAEYTPERVTAALSGTAGMKVRLRLPEQMPKEDVRVFMNGAPAEAEIDCRRHFAEIRLPDEAKVTIEIR